MFCVMGYTGHDLSAAKFKEYLLRTVMRGPDDQRVVEGPFGLMGFGRLAIMGLTPEGMQPFYRGADCVVCNGELYGFRFEKEILKRRGYKFQSDCDCEILLPESRKPTGASASRRFSTPAISFSRMFRSTVSMSSCMGAGTSECPHSGRSGHRSSSCQWGRAGCRRTSQ